MGLRFLKAIVIALLQYRTKIAAVYMFGECRSLAQITRPFLGLHVIATYKFPCFTIPDFNNGAWDRIIRSRDRIIRTRDRIIRTRDRIIRSRDRIIRSRDRIIRSRDRIIRSRDRIIRTRDRIIRSRDRIFRSRDRIIRSPDYTQLVKSGILS